MAVLMVGTTATAGEADAIDACARAATLERDINITSGIHTEQAVAAVPLSISLGAGLAPGRYSDCLRREGVDPTDRAVARFEEAGACSRASRPPVRIVAGDSLRLTPGPGASARRGCLDEELDVEVLSTGR